MSARSLSDDEYTRMVDFLTAAGRLRGRLLLVLGCGTGYRFTELLSLTVGQVWDGEVDLKEVLVSRRNLKGGAGIHRRAVRSRRVPLSAKIQELITEYVASLPAPVLPEAALFPTGRSATAAMNRSSAFRMLAQAARDCGLDHSLPGNPPNPEPMNWCAP